MTTIKTFLFLVWCLFSINAYAIDWSKLVFYAKLNENAANTTVDDSSATNNDGTASANTDTMDTTGQINGALAFDGTKYVEFSNNATYDFTDMTVAVRVRPTTLETNAVMIGRWDYIPNARREWYLGSNSTTKEKITFGTSSNGTTNTAITTNSSYLSNNNWTTIIVTYVNGGTNLIYVNGEPVATTGSAQTSLYYAEQVLRIQNIQDPTASSDFKGDLDDVMIFNYALSAIDAKILHARMIESLINPMVI